MDTIKKYEYNKEIGLGLMKIIKLLFGFFLLLNTINYPQKIGTWSTTDSLNKARIEFSGIKLDDKNFIICGGACPDQEHGSDEVEIFNLETMRWNFAPSMKNKRARHSLVKFSNGDILAIGGFKEKSCEIFDHQKQEWRNTDSLKMSMYYGWNAAFLNNDDVLITGGYNFNPIDSLEIIKDCQRYDYLNGKWSFTTSLNTGRYYHTATLLKNGKVLVTGGKVYDTLWKKTNTCELYDPFSNKWSYAAPMHYERAWHSATLLNNGKVLVVGGEEQTAELYDPDIDKWEDKGKVDFAIGHNQAIILGDEEYLLLVHDYNSYFTDAGWELFSLKNFQSVCYERFEKRITGQVLLKLDDNRVLLAGGLESIVSNDLLLRPTSFCTIYDYNVTGIKTSSIEENSPFDLVSYPNPFNPAATIKYALPKNSIVALEVYSILGEKIAAVVDEIKPAGYHEAVFSAGSCGNGSNLSSGIYICRLTAISLETGERFVKSAKMMLVK